MKKTYLLLSILISSFLPSLCDAQITIIPGVTAATLANKLLGPGVILLNPVLTCDTNAYGTFSGFSTLSFDSGIILTTGQAKTNLLTGAFGAGGPATNHASTGNGSPGDPMLTALAGQPAHDACILEFDFRPAGDTVKFDYIFGSEEYHGFTCSSFNDVFGFFISGPGFATPTNVALIPGTTIPVCINSVNCGMYLGGPLSTCTAMGPGCPFCAYYVDNLTGTTITYDGLTTTLTAIAAVTPCDTYHLKIGIADGTDDIWDSGVFLKAGSLTSTGIHVASSGVNPLDTGFVAQYCVRGCNPGKFIFNRTGNLTDSLTIHFVIGGTAINGFDYTTIADSLTIPAHDSTDTVFIHGLTIPSSGPQTVELYILAPYTCGGLPVIIDSAALTIYDSFYVHINTPNDTAICLGKHVHINTTGASTLTYTWSPSASLDNPALLNPTATPVVTTTYTVAAVIAGAGCAPSHAYITIDVYQPPVLNVGPLVQSTCLGVALQLGVTASPTVPYTYSWTPATYLDNAAIANPVVTPGVVADAEYYVTVSPPVTGCSTTDSFLLHVLPNDFSLFNLDTGICYPPSAYQVRASGDSEFTYHWSPVFGVSNPNILTPIISPQNTTKYIVTGKYPGCPDMVHAVQYSIEHPQVNIITSDTTFCIGLPVPIPVAITPADSPFTFTWSPTANLSDSTTTAPSFFTNNPGAYKYYLTIQSGLGCTSMDSVTMNPAPPLHIGASPGSTIIKYGDHLQLNTINLSAYKLNYYWTPNDGSLDNPNINNPIATPLVPTIYIVKAMNEWGCSDTASVPVDIDFTFVNCLPSGFTPNNDGRNDIFRLCNIHNQRLVEFSVYNRWGQLVYHNTSNPTQGWDGTFNGAPQDMGVYNYMVIIAQPDGTNKTYKGEVTLLR